MIDRKTDWLSRTRDTVAYQLANVVLRSIATPWYRDALDRNMRRGLSQTRQPSTYNITPDVSYLAEATYERNARKLEWRTQWADLDAKTQQTYRMSAAWTINMLIGLRGYTPEGMQ